MKFELEGMWDLELILSMAGISSAFRSNKRSTPRKATIKSKNSKLTVTTDNVADSFHGERFCRSYEVN